LSGQHRDVVSSVAYHPIHPQLVTASYDGGIKCYVGDDLSSS
jgi:WD40 repeat protein